MGQPLVSEALIRSLLPKTGFVRWYCEYAATEHDAPSSFNLACAFTLLASIAPKTMFVRALGNPLRPNLYTLLTGESGRARKSTAIHFARNLLTEAMPDKIALKPGSFEGLLKCLKAQEQQLLVEDELTRFLGQAGSTGASRGHLSSVKNGFIDLYDCAPQSRATAHETLVINDPRLSVLAGIAGENLETYLESCDLTSGYFSRWFYVIGEREREPPPPGLANPRLREALVAALPRFAALCPPGEVLVDLDAARYWKEAFAFMENTASSATEGSRSLASRTVNLIQKLGMLIAMDVTVTSYPDTTLPPNTMMGTAAPRMPPLRITAEIAEQAAQIAYRVSFASGQSLLEFIAPNADWRDRRRILGVLTVDKWTALGELITRTKIGKSRLKFLMESLKEEGLVEEIVSGVHLGPGQKTSMPNGTFYQRLAGRSGHLDMIPATPMMAGAPGLPPPAPTPQAAQVGSPDDDYWNRD